MKQSYFESRYKFEFTPCNINNAPKNQLLNLWNGKIQSSCLITLSSQTKYITNPIQFKNWNSTRIKSGVIELLVKLQIW